MKKLLESLFEYWPALPFITFGLFYVWLDLMTFSGVIFDPSVPGALDLRMEYLAYYFGFSLVVFLLSIPFHKLLNPLIIKRRFSVFACVCLILSTLLCFSTVTFGLPHMMVFIAGIFGACGQACVTLMIVRRFISLPNHLVFIDLALLRLFSVFVFFMVVGLPIAIGSVILLFLPVVMCVVAYYSYSSAAYTALLDRKKADSTGTFPPIKADFEKGERVALARILLVCFCIIFAVNSIGVGESFLWPYVEILSVVFAVISLVLLVWSTSNKSSSFSYWFYIVVFAILAAFMVAGLLPGGNNYSVVVCASFRTVFDLFFLGFLVVILKGTALSLAKLTGIFYGTYLAAVNIGFFTDYLFKGIADLSAYNLFSTVFALVVTFIMLLTFTPNDLKALLGITVVEKTVPPTQDVPADNEPRLRELAEIARVKGLTHREKEVLKLLLEGYTGNMISRKLIISGNTAKSHIRNIYMKFGVSSREELLTLLLDDKL